MGSVPRKPRSTASTVCIIGAGPSGLAAAKYLLAEQAFSRITIFEQRSQVGGLWNHTACPEQALRDQHIPQILPAVELEKPLYSASSSNDVEFLSPIYDRLETNIPRGLMGFTTLDWPDDCQLFPGHEDVLRYLETYANHVRHLIRFRTQVLDVRLDRADKWTVQTQEVNSDEATGSVTMTTTETFDAVVVASGHFNTPYITQVEGLKEWNEAFPCAISHSKYYRRPEDFSDKKVVVVGNSASGVDIAAQIATTCKGPVLISQKSDSSAFFPPNPSSTQVQKPEITAYIVQDRSLRFSDGSVENDIDAIVYCTGYLYSFPFLQSMKPPLITNGEMVHNLYQHLFYREHPTLVFPVLNQKVIPFPLAEAQSAVVARVLAGRLDFPGEEEMKAWEEDTLRETGGGRRFHVLQFPKDADYINFMHDWAMSAREGEGEEEKKARLSGSQNRSEEASPPLWRKKEYWIRERCPVIKKAFQSFGAERHQMRTLEDVGFDFNVWEKEQLS